MATNKNTPPNIVGESFKEYVNGQIKVRQQSHGSGFKSTRSDKDLVYLNSRNAWVKMASSVDVIGQPEPIPNGSLSRGNIINQDTLNKLAQEGIKKLQELGLDPNLTGDQLAKKAILFNGISEFGNKTQPGGVASGNSIFNNSAYGFGGSEFGLQPMPGITSFVIGHNNIGSIRTATVNIRAHSPLQFGIINLLYIRLGFSILVEWGNSMYLDNDGKFQKMGPTLVDEVWFKGGGITPLEFTDLTEKKKEQYNGNYDGFFGKVVNFEYKFNTDGSYDIELKLVSQGDVVESFDLNILTPDYILLDQGDLTNQNDLDNNNILNSLYCFKNTLKEGLVLSRILSGQQDSLAETDEEKLAKDDKYGVLASEGQNIVNPYSKKPGDFSISPFYKEGFGIIPEGFFYDKYYIRFGFFLEFLKTFIPENKTQEKSYPSLEFNVSDDNYSNNLKELISFDPNICFINNGFKDKDFSNFKRYDIVGNPLKGRLLNIYLDGEFIHNTIQGIVKSEKKLSIFNLLKAICNGINNSLANVTALYPSLQDDYMVVIRDANLPSRTGVDGQTLPKEVQSETFELFGYDTSTDTPQSNFVKDFDFTTTISKDLANMISIGATAANEDVSEYSKFFSNLNQGLEDRFKTSNSPGNKDVNLADVCKREETPKKSGGTVGYGALLNMGIKQLAKISTEKGGEDLSNKTAQELKVLLEEKYAKWYYRTLSVRTETFNYVNSVAAQRYFASPEDGQINWEKGKQLFSTITKNHQNLKDDNLPKGTISSNVGFIPMGVNLTLDGIGGMKIYNQLKVNSQHLPVGYPDELELVIMGIDHQIQDNSWITKVRTFTKPSTQPWEVGMDSGVMDFNPDRAFAEDEITSFTQNDPAPEINPTKIGQARYNYSATSKLLQSKGQRNGELDPGYLVNVEGGFLLEKTSAEFFNKWMKALAARGFNVTLISAYRTVEKQRSLSSTNTEPGRTADPGTSAHGWGGAVDLVEFSTSTLPISNLNIRANNPLWRQVAAIGATYGWYNPWRLSDMVGIDEAWHFEYWGTNIGESLFPTTN